MLYSVLVAIDVLIAAGLIGLVLIQQGKGAGMGAAFGAGASGTVFGSRGSASFLSRSTAVLAALFFINSIVLAYLASNRPVSESVMENTVQEEVTTETAPDVPGTIVLPEGASSEDMMDAIKQELDKQSDEPAAPGDVPGVEAQESVAPSMDGSSVSVESESTEAMEEFRSSTEQGGTELPADVPQ
jgi:preprotein translocase subunit SecG